jgi:hypothetical protein
MLGVIQQGSFEFLHLDEPLSIVSRVAEFLAWIYKNKEKKQVIRTVIVSRVTGVLIRIYKNKEKKGISDETGKYQQKI